MKKNIARDIFDAISELSHNLRSQHHQASREQGSNVAGMGFKALAFIASHEGATQKDLVERSGRDKGQIARIVTELKNQQLVEAIADSKDRRISRLRATAQGQALAQQFESRHTELAERAVSSLDQQQCEQLLALLKQLNINLDQSE
ncbi:MarR family winged helix-turn-helix transcriptional regulator [Oceanobacter mangrovi]|uniref:MarR family winged helix-turn-helix transcriptional regulator n=1 Tax=Oceanobacter mangrovi TaxID=2862510 RepID=UPI001C8E9E7F|nr:MarR family winged helix-turn-helix transcriptional regulator [Oceanobacter mangrovi]